MSDTAEPVARRTRRSSRAEAPKSGEGDQAAPVPSRASSRGRKPPAPRAAADGPASDAELAAKTPTKRGRSSGGASRGRQARSSAASSGAAAVVPATPVSPHTDKEGAEEVVIEADPTPASARRKKSPATGRSRSRSPRQARTPAKSLIRDPSGARTPGRRVTFKDQAGLPTVTIVPPISGRQNTINFLVMVGVALPALWIGHAVCTANPRDPALRSPITWPLSDWSELATLAWWQRLGLHHPLWFVNLVFLLNVDVLFWLVALIQGTTWLIDPYWTIIPPLIHAFYLNHPLAAASSGPRTEMATWVLWAWSARLTHSYFRREEWKFGAREDWRFTELSKVYGTHWWWLSFFATYLSQHAMLVGISLPLYTITTNPAPWSAGDWVATIACATGMFIAYVADTQLAAFMESNRKRRDKGQAPVLLLETGLWYYSRHPNYFGENLFWWGLGGFAVRLGHPWLLAGAAFNSLCMIEVTNMTERRMMGRPERAALFAEYKRTTSAWVPWFKFGGKATTQEADKDE